MYVTPYYLLSATYMHAHTRTHTYITYIHIIINVPCFLSVFVVHVV